MLFSALFFPFFSTLRWGVSALGQFAKWVFCNPLRLLVAVAVALAVLAQWQHHEAVKLAAALRQTKLAWAADRQQAQAITAAAQTRYRSIAHDADLAHAQDVAEGDSRLAAYIAAHRLRAGAQADPARAAQGDHSNLPAIPAAQAVVASVSDLQICEADYAYAKAAHEWAMAKPAALNANQARKEKPPSSRRKAGAFCDPWRA